MTNPYLITDNVTLIKAIEQMPAPATYLADTFFSEKLPVGSSEYIGIEYRKGARKLAPYIVEGARGITVKREGSRANLYKAPLVGVRRLISVSDINRRIFGEQPVYSTLTPAERAAQIQAQDMKDLANLIANRRNKFAADILLEGKTVIEGYADDGVNVKVDTIDFDFTGIVTPPALWNTKNAKIYDDLLNAVNKIAEDSGYLPDIMLCGANVEKYLLQNEQMLNFLLVNNNANLSIAGITPKYISPQTRFLGSIPSLGLEMYSYLETYTDSDNTVKKFIPDDSVIIAKAGLGRQMFGAVTLIDDNLGVNTYAAEVVPDYASSRQLQNLSLTLYSRFILAPNELGSWIHIKTCG